MNSVLCCEIFCCRSPSLLPSWLSLFFLCRSDGFFLGYEDLTHGHSGDSGGRGGASSSLSTSGSLGVRGAGAGSSTPGAVSGPRAGSSGAGSSRPSGSGSISRPGGGPGSSPASTDVSMGALATLISRAVAEGLVAAGGTLGHLPVLPGVSDSGAAAPPSTVAPTPPTSSLPPARGELYSSRGSFRGGGLLFVSA